MPSPDEIKERLKLSDAFLAGERILGIKFRHNSHVAFVSEDGVRYEGWIVSASYQPESIYTVECCDGSGDEEVPESKIELILDPHEPNGLTSQLRGEVVCSGVAGGKPDRNPRRDRCGV